MKHIETTRWELSPEPAGSATSGPVDELGYLDPSTPAAPGAARRLLGFPALWFQRVRRRNALARTPARDLRDAGLSLEAVAHELAQPFWRPLGAERK
jgi:uncharacterized protein YjiS (DUF1127 family)